MALFTKMVGKAMAAVVLNHRLFMAMLAAPADMTAENVISPSPG